MPVSGTISNERYMENTVKNIDPFEGISSDEILNNVVNEINCVLHREQENKMINHLLIDQIEDVLQKINVVIKN